MMNVFFGFLAAALLLGGLYLRATSPSDLQLQIGPTTTVVSEPRNAQGGIDFDAAMQASEASEQRLQELFQVLVLGRNSTDDCAPLDDDTRVKITTIALEPLRMRRSASHVTEASQQLVTRLLFVMKRLACACGKQPATARDSGQLLTTLSAYLSSSNQDTFYHLHPLAAHAASTCFAVAKSRPDLGGLHFFDAIEHLQLVRLSMLEEIVSRTDLDPNAALTAFNDDFMRALDGAPLAPMTEEPKFSWLKSADENRREKSQFIGRSYAQQVPEIVSATQLAAENTANERRSWE